MPPNEAEETMKIRLITALVGIAANQIWATGEWITDIKGKDWPIQIKGNLYFPVAAVRTSECLELAFDC
jgi:hypothetical protein